MWPTLIAMCGLPFTGKSVLPVLNHEFGIRLLSYDFEIYLPHRHLVPPGSSAAAEYDFVQDIARRQIGALLAAGESLIYDDLLLGRNDRRKLAVVARHHRADFVLVYLDTPLAVIDQRRRIMRGRGPGTASPRARFGLKPRCLSRQTPPSRRSLSGPAMT